MAHVAKGGVLSIAGLLASGALQALLVVVVSRGLGPVEIGVFFEAVALFTILSNVGELGADAGLVRTVSRYIAQNRARDVRRTIIIALMPVLIVGILVAVGVFVSAPQLVRLFFHDAHPADEVLLLRYLIPFLPLASGVTVMLAATRGFGSMLPSVAIQAVTIQGGRCLLVYLAVAAGLPAVDVSLGWAAPQSLAFLFTAIVLVVMLRAAERSNPVIADARPSTRHLASEFWRFSAPRALAAVFGITIAWLDVLLVGALRSTAEAGIYAAISRVSVLGVLVLDAIGMPLAPQLSSLIARGRIRDAQHVYAVATSWLLALTWPLYLLLATFAPVVLQILGPRFAGGQQALVVLSLAQLVNIGTGNVLVLLLMAGKSWMNLVNAFVALALNVGLNVILIPRFGIDGAAIAWAASIVVANVAALVEVRFLLGIRPFAPGYWRAAGTAVAVYGVAGFGVRVMFGASLGSFFVFTAAATTIYGFLLWRARHVLELGWLWRAAVAARASNESRVTVTPSK